jgi:hypothetical protein
MPKRQPRELDRTLGKQADAVSRTPLIFTATCATSSVNSDLSEWSSLCPSFIQAGCLSMVAQLYMLPPLLSKYMRIWRVSHAINQ